jgi:hypothetical protein
MVQESLAGTQARQLFVAEKQHGKIRRVHPRFLEVDANDMRIGDIPLLLAELRRLVIALDDRGGFTDE